MSQQARVEYLLRTYAKDVEQFMAPYRRVCAETGTTPIDLSKLKFETKPAAEIGLGTLETAIEEHIAKIEKKHPHIAKKRRGDRKAELAAREEAHSADKPACVKCGGKKWLFINCRSKDCSYVTLPSGTEIEGYCPTFTSLTESAGDGAFFDLCISCGAIKDLDLAVLRREIDEAQARADGRESDGLESDSDNDDDDSE